MSLKESENGHKYQSLARYFNPMYQVTAIVVPVAIGQTKMISIQCKQFLQSVDPRVFFWFDVLQKTAQLGTTISCNLLLSCCSVLQYRIPFYISVPLYLLIYSTV